MGTEVGRVGCARATCAMVAMGKSGCRGAVGPPPTPDWDNKGALRAVSKPTPLGFKVTDRPMPMPTVRERETE